MSRIGKLPLQIPAGVTVEDKSTSIYVKGPKGDIAIERPRRVNIEIADSQIGVTPKTKAQKDHAQQGLTRTIISNAIKGVTEGFSKSLEINGVGYIGRKFPARKSL